MKHRVRALQVTVITYRAMVLYIDIATCKNKFWMELYSEYGELLKSGISTDDLLEGYNVKRIMPAS